MAQPFIVWFIVPHEATIWTPARTLYCASLVAQTFPPAGAVAQRPNVTVIYGRDARDKTRGVPAYLEGVPVVHASVYSTSGRDGKGGSCKNSRVLYEEIKTQTGGAIDIRPWLERGFWITGKGHDIIEYSANTRHLSYEAAGEALNAYFHEIGGDPRRNFLMEQLVHNCKRTGAPLPYNGIDGMGRHVGTDVSVPRGKKQARPSVIDRVIDAARLLTGNGVREVTIDMILRRITVRGEKPITVMQPYENVHEF